MKTAIILGANSDIAKGMLPLMQADGWTVHGWVRDDPPVFEQWDLVISAIGTVAPVGMWYDQHHWQWSEGVYSNLFLPMELLRGIWKWRNPDAAVCFLAGSNPNMIMKGYSAYNVGKMALLKMCEQLDVESPDTKFFALGPGTILTKIHNPTLFANWDNQKLAKENEVRGLLGHEYPREHKIALVYECLKWCLKQPKNVIGGRNICVSDRWEMSHLAEHLKDRPDMYKLRRME